MDKFLGKKHNIQPVAVASSLQGDSTPCSSDSEQALEDTGPPAKKIRSSISKNVKERKSQGLMEELRQSAQAREVNRERRHQELLNIRTKAVNIFSTKMDELIKSINKNDKDKQNNVDK
ncbi:hypothetical protein PPYR_09826 [Photinus pyralis]|nr:hypothetical protein PPYR_09826 [Photinus pyralis]